MLRSTYFSKAPVEEAEIARPVSTDILLGSSATGAAKTSAIATNSPDQELKSSSSDDQDSDEEACVKLHEMRKYLDRSFALDIDHTFTCLFTGESHSISPNPSPDSIPLWCTAPKIFRKRWTSCANCFFQLPHLYDFHKPFNLHSL